MLDDIIRLKHKEKVFLAGSIKNMVLANSFFSEQEVDDLSAYNTTSPFPNYEQYLAEFEKKIKTKEDYWYYAGKIKNCRAQDVILDFLYTFSLEDGYMSDSEASFYKQLENLWLNKE